MYVKSENSTEDKFFGKNDRAGRTFRSIEDALRPIAEEACGISILLEKKHVPGYITPEIAGILHGTKENAS